MEEQAESLLSGQSHRIESYPALEGPMNRHLEDTRSQRLLRTEADLGEAKR